ncbi:hypothetical protein FOCC_FOCC009349, partial [Frankliniella occidentalis]
MWSSSLSSFSYSHEVCGARPFRPRGPVCRTAAEGAHRDRQAQLGRAARRRLRVRVRDRQRHQGRGSGTALRRRPRGPRHRRPGSVRLRGRRRPDLLRAVRRRRERIPAAGSSPAHPTPNPRGHPPLPRVQRQELQGRGRAAPAAAAAGLQARQGLWPSSLSELTRTRRLIPW